MIADGLLQCRGCGRHTHHDEAYPVDAGFGMMCKWCGEGLECTCCPARPLLGVLSLILEEKLSGDALRKFDAMSYPAKCYIIARLIERGVMM